MTQSVYVALDLSEGCIAGTVVNGVGVEVEGAQQQQQQQRQQQQQQEELP